MSFEDVLKGLQRDYLAQLPDKIVVIRGQIQIGSASELRNSFHKLKGTGKTYGLPEVSELAAAVESICQNSPKEAQRVAQQALLILEDIHSARSADLQFSLSNDPRFLQIHKLLS